jgi:succinate dehydrogenase / fumarate reductase iron-sulfur subunit
MRLTLHIWRQDGPHSAGRLVRYVVSDASPAMSFLDLLDHLNERLAASGERPIAFDSDCREGICGACGVVINGRAHGPLKKTTTCQLPLSAFRDGDEITVEPFRARAFPLLRDLCVDRSALDRIVASGGFVSVKTGSAPEANSLPIAKPIAEAALDAAACIGCGACVAACPNGSASLFTAAKLRHLTLLPQGQPERARRTQKMVTAMDDEAFGGCTQFGECQRACPKDIRIEQIAAMNREHLRAVLRSPITDSDDRTSGSG